MLGRSLIGAANATKPLDAQLRALGRRTTEIGRYMTRNFTMPMLLAAGASAKLAYDFDKSMSRIQSLAGASASEVQHLKKEVLDMASSTLTPGPQKLAEALYFIRSSGIAASEAMGVLKAANQGAMIGLGDIQTVADATTSAMNAYGHANLSAAQAVDIMTATVTVGKAETDQLARSIGYVIPLASEMGVKFKEVGGLLAAMTLQGLGTSTAVTGLRAILTTFTRGLPITQKALARLGFGLQEVQKAIRTQGLDPVLNSIRQAVDAVDKSGGKITANAQRIFKKFGAEGAAAFLKLKAKQGDTAASLLSQLFPNVRALTAFLAVTGKNAKATANTIGQVGDSAGITARKFNEIRKQNWAQLLETWNKLRTEVTRLGEDILPVFTLLLKVALRVFRVFTFDWAGPFKVLFKPVQHLIALLALVLFAIGPILATFGALIRISSVYVLRRQSDSAKAAAASAREVAALETVATATAQNARTATLTAAATVTGVDAATAAYAREALAVDAVSIAQARAARAQAAGLILPGGVMGGVAGKGGLAAGEEKAIIGARGETLAVVKGIAPEAEKAAASVGRLGAAFGGMRAAGIAAGIGIRAAFAWAWPLLVIEALFEIWQNWDAISKATYRAGQALKDYVGNLPGVHSIWHAFKGIESSIVGAAKHIPGVQQAFNAFNAQPGWLKNAERIAALSGISPLAAALKVAYDHGKKLTDEQKKMAKEAGKTNSFVVQYAKMLGISVAEAKRLLGLAKDTGKAYREAAQNAQNAFETAFDRLTGDMQTLFDAKTDKMTESFDRKTQAHLDLFDQNTEDTWSSMATKFERHTDDMLYAFDNKTDDTWTRMQQKFEDKTESMVKKMKVAVKVAGEQFVISPGQLTPAERELKALEKAADLRSAQRSLMEGGREAVQAIAIGDPYALEAAQQKIEDAQTDIKKQGLTARAEVERKAADAALDAGEKALRRRRDREETLLDRWYHHMRDRERQHIQDIRDRLERDEERAYRKRREALRQRYEDERAQLRSNLIAERNLEWRHLSDRLKSLETQLEKRRISIDTFNKKLRALMPEFGLTAHDGAVTIGKAFGQQMEESLKGLATTIARHAKYLGNKHKEIAARAEDTATRVSNAWKRMADNIDKQVQRIVASMAGLPPGLQGPLGTPGGGGLPPGLTGPVGGGGGGGNYPTLTKSGYGQVSAQQFNAAAKAFGIPPALLRSLVRTESGGRQFDKYGNVLTSSAGALGVAQLMPDTAKALGVDPKKLLPNLVGGAKYLKQMYDRFGSWFKALVAYNEGPNKLAQGVIYKSAREYANTILAWWKKFPGQGAPLGGGVPSTTPAYTGPATSRGPRIVQPSMGGGGVVAAVAYGASQARGHGSINFHLGGEARPYDCSAFVQAAFKSAGISIGRTTVTQYASGKKLKRGQLLPGDLVFFFYPGVDDVDPGHVGIYMGAGMMVHDRGANSGGVYYQAVDWSHYRGARCYLKGHVHYAQGMDAPRGSAPSAAPAARGAAAAGSRALQTAGGSTVVGLARGAARSLAGAASKAKGMFVLPGPHPGLIKPGNIDLSRRTIVRNADGSYSTVESMSIEVDGKEVLIPRVVNGRVLSEKDAIAHWRKTHENLGTFKGPKTATAYAQRLHRQQARYVARIARRPIPGIPKWLQGEAHQTVRQIADRYVGYSKLMWDKAHGKRVTPAMILATMPPHIAGTLSAAQVRRLGGRNSPAYLNYIQKLAMIESNPLGTGLIQTHGGSAPWTLGTAGSTGSVQNITINVFESGNPRKTATEVRNILQKQKARNAKSVRGRRTGGDTVGLK